MPTANLDPTTLTTFQHAAAGHEGPMSDPTGTLFIKPCTKTEIEFYEAANASYPAMAAFMPTYMGTLSITPSSEPSTTEIKPKIPDPIKDAASARFPASAGPLKGRKISTDLHIVLQNAAARFTKANVLDLKLGAQLWDDDATPEKRARLDAVSQATTSGSLGFRIAGKRTWQGPKAGVISQSCREAKEAGMGDLDEETNMFSCNKFYGRQFDRDSVLKGFRDFMLVPNAGIDVEHAIGLTQAFLDGTRKLQSTLQETEFRMFGGSILYTYEGDGRVFDAKHKATMTNEQHTNGGSEGLQFDDQEDDDEEDDDEEDEEEDKNVLLTIRVIDFAHARFVPGDGPDQNILQGVSSIIKLLETLLEELTQKAEVDKSS